MWQNGSTAPPINIQRSAPRATFHVRVRKSVHSCNITTPTKKYLGTKSETKQEVGYFEFCRHILCHFCHFQVSYFIELLPDIYSDEQQNWSLQSKALCDVKLRRSRVFIGGRVRGILSNFDVSPWNRKLFISGMLCPICTKLHIFDKNPDLKRSKWPIQLVIAPPAGNRKWHVLICN